jgi:hypothetical protein
VAKEYSKRCKKGARKKENTKEVLKCWNLEPVIDADLIGDSQPSELIMNELVPMVARQIPLPLPPQRKYKRW